MIYLLLFVAMFGALFADVRISMQIRQQLSLTDLLNIKRLAKNASLSLPCFVLALISLMLPDNSRYMVLCITGMTFFEALSWHLDYKLKQEIDKKAVNNDD